MVVHIGLVGQRADLAVEVAALAARAGASVVSLGWGEVREAARGAGAGVAVDLVLVDVLADLPALSARTSDPLTVEPRTSDPLTVEPRTPGAAVIVVCRAGEGPAARESAAALGCAHVVELPLGAPWLESQLAPGRGSAVLGVVGAVGGVGATTVAIACAVGAGVECLLVDADPDSPGLDLPLGIPEGAGVRWAQIPDTSQPLDPASVRSALPRVGAVSVATGAGICRGGTRCPGPGCSHGSGQVAGVIGVGRAEFPRTVVDVGRGRPAAGLLGPGDPVALVLPATLSGVVAGRRVLADLTSQQVVVLLRPTGWLPTDEVAGKLGVPVVLEVPRLGRAAELADCGDLLSGRTGRTLRRLGERIWGQLD